ncbi:MAG: acyl-CoA/acyl-ACP dehydrogenase [Proteobacteria bacterium]|nr:acyl-CoA/acyl-ACP dehydrogenase [Pseudomonadota bacterium]
MDFSYSQEQRDLRDVAARMFAQRFTDEHRKAFARSGEPFDARLWSACADAGLLGAAIGTDRGGSGLGLTEVCLMLEEQGRTLAALPLCETLLLGALPLERFGGPAQHPRLRQVLAGTLLLTAALEEPAALDPARPGTRAEVAGEGYRLSGIKTCVPYGAQAGYLLVSAQLAGVARVFVVARDAPGVEVRAQRGTAGTPLALLRLDAVAVGAQDLLGAAAADEVLPWMLDRARVGHCALQLGVAAEALRRAAAYTAERRQFGRPLGSFQAVQHRLADCYIDVEALRSAYLRAVWALDNAVPARAEVLAAQWWAAQCGHRVTHAVQHVHGGLGADLEYPVHAFFLRAKELELSLGGASPTLAAIGRELQAGLVAPFT